MTPEERIDQYLTGRMTAEESSAFERELDRDEGLRRQYEFQRDLADFFQHAPPELEDQLDRLGDRYFSDPPPGDAPSSGRKGSGGKWWLPVLLLLFVGGGVGWWLVTDEGSLTPPSSSVPIKPFVEPNEETQLPVIESQEALPPPGQNVPETPTPQPEAPNRSEDRPSAPIARLDPADVVPNPVLENLLRENLRDDYETELRIPDTLRTGETFTLRGTTTAPPLYTLSLFSNRPFDFDNDYPSLRVQIDATNAAASTEPNRLDWRAEMDLRPGLYYWLLQDAEQNLLAAGRQIRW